MKGAEGEGKKGGRAHTRTSVHHWRRRTKAQQRRAVQKRRGRARDTIRGSRSYPGRPCPGAICIRCSGLACFRR